METQTLVLSGFLTEQADGEVVGSVTGVTPAEDVPADVVVGMDLFDAFAILRKYGWTVTYNTARAEIGTGKSELTYWLVQNATRRTKPSGNRPRPPRGAACWVKKQVADDRGEGTHWIYWEVSGGETTFVVRTVENIRSSAWFIGDIRYGVEHWYVPIGTYQRGEQAMPKSYPDAERAAEAACRIIDDWLNEPDADGGFRS